MLSKMDNLINKPKALEGKDSNYHSRNSSRQFEEEAKTVAAKPAPKTLAVPKQESNMGLQKKAYTPSYLSKKTPQIQKSKSPYSSSKQLHQKPVRPYATNAKPKQSTSRQPPALLPSQIHTNTRNVMDSLDKGDSVSAHNPFNENEY